jgi:hypothetical protein
MPSHFDPAIVAQRAAAHTNTMAILALIFGLAGGLLGIFFGHIARAQIRRTGEQGWGLATAGLVLGYLFLISGLIFAIVMVGNAIRYS